MRHVTDCRAPTVKTAPQGQIYNFVLAEELLELVSALPQAGNVRGRATKKLPIDEVAEPPQNP